MMLISCILFGCLFLGFFIVDTVTPDRYFSRNENRILAPKPGFGYENLLKGVYAEEYEAYITDQFIARDGWIRLKNYGELILQKKELNGVYLTADKSLIEKHAVSLVDGEKAADKADKLAKRTAEYEKLLGRGHVKVLLAPTADVILSDRLPAFAEEYDQISYLRQIQEGLASQDIFIPVADALAARRTEYIYYRTDHHWTALGAYYAYLEWASGTGEEPAVEWNPRQVSRDFLGTLHSRINIKVPPDSIDINENTYSDTCRVEYIYEGKTADSLYDYGKLKTKDQYAVFLGGNFPLISIETPARNGKKLLVIKDSYANCFIPFLTSHYQYLYVLDPRFYRDDVKKVIREREITDVLILYDIIHFIDNY